MDSIKELEARRDTVLDQMRSIRSMRRGTINEQYLKVPQKGKREPAVRGPYYVMSRREGKKTVSSRITSDADLAQARKDIDEHKRFMFLCREFEQLTERLGEFERQTPELEVKKKRRRSRSSKTRK